MNISSLQKEEKFFFSSFVFQITTKNHIDISHNFSPENNKYSQIR